MRNGIYLPAGDQWVDYWTGALHEGGTVLNGHPAPLDRLPVFVRAGAVIPQGVVARNASLVPEDAPITVVAYPQGESAFELYEDDEVTRAYADGESSSQRFTVDAPKAGKTGTVKIELGERDGTYDGKADARPYRVEAHTGSEPKVVKLGSRTLPRVADAAALDDGPGWTYEADRAGGVVLIATGAIASDETARLTLTATSGVGGQEADAAAASVAVELADRVFQGEQTTVTATFRNTGTKAKDDVVLTPAAPEGWTLVSASGDRGRHREAGRLRHGRVHLRGDGCRSSRPADRDGHRGLHVAEAGAHGVRGEPALRRVRIAGRCLQRRVRSPTSRPRRPGTSTAAAPRSPRRRSQPQG